MRDNTFRYESDMIAPAKGWLVSEKLSIKAEFAMPFGICDLVGISMSQENIQKRIDNGQFQPIGSLLRTEILSVIPDVGKTKGITHPTLLRKFDYLENDRNIERELFLLESRKFIRRTKTGSYQKLNGWLPLHDRIVALELKLNRVREALSQAIRNSRFADESYIGLPEETAHRICNSCQINEFKTYGIGILAVRSRNCEVLLTSRIRKKNKDTPMQIYCADRFWSTAIKDTST